MEVPDSALETIARSKKLYELENIVDSLKGQRTKSNQTLQKIRVYEQVLAEFKADSEGDVKDLNEPFSITVSRKHINLYKSAMNRGKEFNLSVSDVRRLLTKKTCAYTGVKLTESLGGNNPTRPTDRTIERVDDSKGYVKGNVVAVCYQANHLKNVLLEQPDHNCCVGIDMLEKFVNNYRKLTKK